MTALRGALQLRGAKGVKPLGGSLFGLLILGGVSHPLDARGSAPSHASCKRLPFGSGIYLPNSLAVSSHSSIAS